MFTDPTRACSRYKGGRSNTADSMLQKFTEAADLIDAKKQMKKTMWGQFWSSHQRFFKYLCKASKVKHVCQVAKEDQRMGTCIIISLQSTGDLLILILIRIPRRGPSYRAGRAGGGAERLLVHLQRRAAVADGEALPRPGPRQDHRQDHTLDELINELGGPSLVSEITGRKGR
jgi:hypothetical protein